jgi:hypothetical protein
MNEENNMTDRSNDTKALQWDDQHITYHCKHCEGTDEISASEDSQNASDIAMESCPFCKMKIQLPNKNEPGE